jgi:membrane protein DedA with SNARE-associated domain
MDAAGIVAGATRYPIGRYLIAMFAGKLLLLVVLFLAARRFVDALAFLNGWTALG